jgi:hypothetical protein
MIGPHPLSTFRHVLLVLFVLAGTPLLVARNDVTWNYINLPGAGTLGQTIYFSASVTNAGDAPWEGDHYLELRDHNGVHLNYIALATTPEGYTRTAAFELKLPLAPGTYTYHFMAVQHGVQYFGPSLSRTIVVRKAPLEVSLTLEDESIVVGEHTIVRSAASPDPNLAAHGVEGRVLGGRWQTWATWEAAGGEPQVAFPCPPTSGVYEVRAFAMREGDDPAFSERATLIVNAVPPAIVTQPAGAFANVGQVVTLSATISGSEPAFQWRKDGVNVPGATNASLTLSPAHVVQSGSYQLIAANSAGAVTTRAVDVVINALSLPAMTVETWHFPAGGTKRATPLASAQVGDVVSVQSVANLTAGAGWRHNILVRRPSITASTAMVPEDASGFTNATEAWNRDGWGSPHTDGNSYNISVTGHAAVDLGRREPFMHVLTTGQAGSTRALDFVLDAPGAWLIRAEIVDAAGQQIALSPTTSVTVNAAALVGDAASITYPYGREDKFVGVFWNAGQAHRLWSTWRAEFQSAYPGTWAVNWKLMWQPSPYFRRPDGSWFNPSPATDSPWQAFWSAHQVYALVPDGNGRSMLTHDLTSRAFAEKAAVRLMDVGVDFVAVDYTNQFLEEREDVFPAVNNLAQAFQSVAQQSQSGQRIKLTAVVPANVSSGDWNGNGGFGPLSISRFNAKLTTLYNRFARDQSAWFHLEDDKGTRKPLLLLWIGASGESELDGKVAPALLNYLKLADGRLMTDVFTIRWVGAYLTLNRRFLTGGSYSVTGPAGAVSGKYANPKFWSYHEGYPSAATVMPGASGNSPAVEAVTVQPLALGRDRFGRVWDQNWPAGQGYHYETPANNEPIPLGNYGRTWAEALAVARALNPKFLLTTWAEFGSENDEPRPELSVTVMDNNKFGTHFGDAFKQAVRLFKYRAPTGWIDTFKVGDGTNWFTDVTSTSLVLGQNQTVQLQGWVTPNVASTFAGGSVKIFLNGEFKGNATVGGAWNNATRWTFDLSAASLGTGHHIVKVLFDDGAGGTSLAGVRFRGEQATSTLAVDIY